MRLRSLLLVTALVLALIPWSSLASAQDTTTDDARTYFRAGAQAYDAGEYLTAIQAFEAALALSRRSGIVFSIAQSYRQQFYVARQVSHLRNSIEHYRRYLTMVSQGGRRAEAARHVAELEPVLDQLLAEGASEESSEKSQTRVMVATETERARVSLDDGPLEDSPFIAELAPGEHRIVVSAPGYETSSRNFEAVEGALIALEVNLRERPAGLVVHAPKRSRVSVDGRYVGTAPLRAMELPSGRHVLTVTMNGKVPVHRAIHLTRDEELTVDVDLAVTAQRRWAVGTIGLGAVGVLTSGALTGLALHEEQQAKTLDHRRRTETLSPDQLTAFNEAIDRRNRWRTGAGVSAGVGLALAVTGLLMYAFDRPEQSSLEVFDPSLDGSSGKAPQVSFSPWFGPQASGGAFLGRF